MPNFLAIILVALAPCVFWLWIIYLGDRCKPGPKALMISTFLLGMAVAVPAAFIESMLYPHSLSGNLSVPTAAYAAFAVAGVIEESGKFLVVRLGAYRSHIFSQPEDGLIYTASAALGFASLENIAYIISFGMQVIIFRGLFSNLSHVLFSALWGYPLVLTKLGIIKNKYMTYLGLIAAIIAHGAFDFLFLTGTVFTWLVVPLFVGMVVVFILMMRHTNKIATCKPNFN